MVVIHLEGDVMDIISPSNQPTSRVVPSELYIVLLIVLTGVNTPACDMSSFQDLGHHVL